MNYEKKYKEALEWMRSVYDGLHGATKEDAEHYFPELKESEDEKIIKFLKKCVQQPMGTNFLGDINKVDVLAWLEKQSEPADKGEISDGYHTFNELYYYRMLYNAAFFNMLPKEWVHKSKKHHDGEECFGGDWFIVMANLPTGQISNHYELKDWHLFQIPEKEVADKWDGHTPQEAADRLHKYLLEKQGEQQNPYSGVSFEYNGHTWGMCARDGGVEILMDSELKAFVSLDKSFVYPTHPQPDFAPKTALEAINEVEGGNRYGVNDTPYNYEHATIAQKDFAPKEEPKFKVDDWVVRGNITAQILDIQEQYYVGIDTNGNDFTSSRFLSDDKIHLWSIQDTKDGDVLVEDSCIFIIQKLGNNNTAAKTYCTLYNDGDFDDGSMLYFDIDSTKPATKEQRELLFQKMYEAGYTFDFKKKEFKNLKFRVGDEIKTFNKESLTITKIDEKGYWSNDLFICDFDSECIWDLVDYTDYST